MRNFSQTKILVVSVVATMVMIGAGCLTAADETSETIVTGAVKTPIVALEQAKQLTAEEQARLNRDAEATSNYVTVALILTEGASIPDGAVIGPTIGCNDRIAFVPMSRVSDSGEVVIDALNTLFAQKDPSYKEYYSALALSDVRVTNRYVATDGVNVAIYLEGSFNSGGTCDDPRIKSQIEETIRRLYPNFRIVLNGSESEWRCFGDQSGLCK